MAAVIIVLYFLPFFVDLGAATDKLAIDERSVIVAAATLLLSVVAYLWTPRTFVLAASTAVYFLLVITGGTLIVSAGGVHSSFMALWIGLSLFAPVFGWWGTVPILLMDAVYGVYLVATRPVIPVGDIAIIVAGGVVPLVAGYIIWHVRGRRETSTEDQAYNKLASQLSQATTKAEVVIKAINDGVIALDSQGNIELFNPAAQHIIGWGAGDALSLNYQSVLKLVDKDNQPINDAVNPIAQVLTTNQSVRSDELGIVTEGGKHVLLSIVVSPIGQPGEGVIIVFRDITREKQEEREQGEFISTASHEMRTPVASIEGYLGLALNPATATIDAKARDFIEKAHESAQHLGRLFQDLLDVSKAEDGRLSNNPKIVDIVEFVGVIVEGLRHKADEKHLHFYYKPRPSPTEAPGALNLTPVFYAKVDPDHLREVVSNLIENAIKYTPRGDVIVDVTGEDDLLKILVKDSGIGIPREDIPHLFQKFYRVDNSATREIGGTGLGLYLCRRLAETMGGRIGVESEFQKGSTFFLELPRISREDAMRELDAMSAEPPAISQVSFDDPFNQAASTPTPTPAAPRAPAEPVTAPPPPTLSTIEKDPAEFVRGGALKIPIRDDQQQN